MLCIINHKIGLKIGLQPNSRRNRSIKPQAMRKKTTSRMRLLNPITTKLKTKAIQTIALINKIKAAMLTTIL